jgi:hypothetical protein
VEECLVIGPLGANEQEYTEYWLKRCKAVNDLAT